MESIKHRIAVLGGGITGLAAAYTLARQRESGAPIDELLIEASKRLGGVVEAEQLGAFLVEGGPDSFISEKPEAAQLCRELGLADQLIGSNDRVRKTYILHNGRLVPLPDGLMFLVPTSVRSILASPLLSIKSKLVIASEMLTARRERDPNSDESVSAFVIRHFGCEMFENIAQPLLTGVYGGDPDCLSLDSVLPRFRQLEREHGSLVRGALRLRNQKRQTGEQAERPLFMTLRKGMGDLIGHLARRIEPQRIKLQRVVSAVDRTSSDSDAEFRVICEGGEVYRADAVVLAMPASQCANLLSTYDPELARELKEIQYNSAITISLGYGEEVRRAIPPGFGFLVPRKERRRILACTFAHNKFNGRAPADGALLRCFIGGSGDYGASALADSDLISIARGELRSILKIEAEPLFSRVFRWPGAMAQYTVGHQQRIERIGKLAGKHRGLFLAGNAYEGIGLPDCIRSGRQAAERALQILPEAKA